MAEPQSVKCADTISDVHIDTTTPSPDEISQRIEQLDAHTIATVLTQAAQIHPEVMSMVDDAIRVIREREQNHIVGFDHHSKSIWKMINVTHRSERDDVADHIFDTIKSIVDQCGPHTHPQTRFNGLSALCKIGKTIVLSSDSLMSEEVQNQFADDMSLMSGMLDIASRMTMDEMREIRENESSPEALWPRLQELKELSQKEDIDLGIDQVLEELEYDVFGYEEDESESEENDGDKD
ncbi:unnamed protein product [Penicillium glandicola]